ncbi:MAG: HlyD family efflux transporter periplasmic adaptor subunit, partial [Tepidanaerobacteraceae bacterium]|nr:HlyD family efflux transporter periplasmic adaptor subunit [Tepidanaerobacteraceae bacterium]
YYISLGDSDEKIKAKLTNIQGDASLGVFLINRDLEGFLDSRKIRVEVVTGTYTGYKIPATALVLNEEGEGVYIIERGKRLFKPVEIVTQNENDIIVTGLKLGDKILLNKRRSIWFD